ncbi:hypothetical protein FQN49_004681, partial [Arthroderma sp. PD_2]
SSEADNIIRLPEVHPKTFSMFVQWLYTGDSWPGLLSPCMADKEAETQNADQALKENEWRSDEGPVDYSLLFSVYIFANSIDAPILKSHIYDEICFAGETGYPQLRLDDIRYAYQNTSSKDDPLRLFCLYKVCGPCLQRHLKDPDFLSLCEEVGSFGAGVLKQCGKMMRS